MLGPHVQESIFCFCSEINECRIVASTTLPCSNLGKDIKTKLFLIVATKAMEWRPSTVKG